MWGLSSLFNSASSYLQKLFTTYEGVLSGLKPTYHQILENLSEGNKRTSQTVMGDIKQHIQSMQNRGWQTKSNGELQGCESSGNTILRFPDAVTYQDIASMVFKVSEETQPLILAELPSIDGMLIGVQNKSLNTSCMLIARRPNFNNQVIITSEVDVSFDANFGLKFKHQSNADYNLKPTEFSEFNDKWVAKGRIGPIFPAIGQCFSNLLENFSNRPILGK